MSTREERVASGYLEAVPRHYVDEINLPVDRRRGPELVRIKPGQLQ